MSATRTTQTIGRKGPSFPRARPPRFQRRIALGKGAIFLLLAAYLLIVVFPMFWLLYSSLKTDAAIVASPFALPQWSSMAWDNYARAWLEGRFGQLLFNSIFMTTTSVVVTVFLAATVAFAVTRYQFRLAQPILFFFLAGLMIPIQLAIVPLFFELKQWGLLNTRLGLFLAYVGFGLPFSVFLLAGFFKTLPSSLHEAARLDGCNEWQVFWWVMLPLSRPGLLTVAIFLFLGNWNEFFVAFIMLGGEGGEALRTLPLGLANITIVSQYRSDWGMALAGLVLMMLPALIVYAAMQKHLTSGITAGAIKG